MECPNVSADHVTMFENLSPTTRTVLRVAAGIAIGIAAGFATVVLFFIGAVTITGCFISCSDPNVIGGSFLLSGAVLSASLTVTAVVWGATGWQRRTLVRVATTVGVLASLLVLAVMSSS
jgi:hypothetical protein